MRTAFALCAAALLRAYAAHAQAPFSLDTTFRATFPTWYVASALPLPDGKVLVAGQVHPPDEPFPLIHAGLCRLNADGSWDESFPESSIGRGKITPWVDRFYVSSSQTVRRVHYNGAQDFSFIEMNLGLYFTSLQGGDYHVFPDGRVVMSGMHMLNDPVRGFVGDYNFIWFSNQGYLDTTRTHRSGNGALYDFIELPDGKFIADYNGTVYDGRPTSGIQRMHPDGSLDTTFYAGVQWGEAQCFLPAPGGRVYAAGMFGLAAAPTDTLHLVRLLPNGQLDPAFNNTLHLDLGDLDGLGGTIFTMHQLTEDRILVLGKFVAVDGVAHRGLAVVDTTGTLVDLGAGTGCGPYIYQGYNYGGFQGAAPYGEDQLLVFGAYHGYDDGVVNDTAQRFISRLNIGSLYVGEAERSGSTSLSTYPNPASGSLTVDLAGPYTPGMLVLRDALGHRVLELRCGSATCRLDLNTIANGTYHLHLVTDNGFGAVQRIVVQH